MCDGGSHGTWRDIGSICLEMRGRDAISREEGREREEVVVKGPLLELWGDVTNGGYDGWTMGGREGESKGEGGGRESRLLVANE